MGNPTIDWFAANRECLAQTLKTNQQKCEVYGWPRSLDHEKGKIRCIQTDAGGPRVSPSLTAHNSVPSPAW